MKYVLFYASALMVTSVASGIAVAQTPSPVVGKKLADGEAYVTMAKLQHQQNPRDNGRILLAFEEFGWKGMPIWESLDDGDSWAEVTHATDKVKGPDSRCNLHWQPHLIEMPRAIGDLQPGTILMAASAVCPEADSFQTEDMQLRLYTSTDAGRTWTYRSEIIQASGALPVWEPHLDLLDDGKIVAYYSSEAHKDRGYNQLLAHKVSLDGGRTWGAEVFDIAISGGVERPGMVITDRLTDGRYIYSYEAVNGPKIGDQVFLKYSRAGGHWDQNDRGTPIIADGGQYPASTPNIWWFPVGGPKGVIVVSAREADGGGDRQGRSFFWNNNDGVGPWWEVPAPVQKRGSNVRTGWTQGLMLRPDGRFLHVTSSGDEKEPENATKNVLLYNSAPLDFTRYEAENAKREGGALIHDRSASNSVKVRLASKGIGKLTYRITLFRPGDYKLALTYSSIGLEGTPALRANGRAVNATSAALPGGEAGLAARNADLGTRGTGEKLALTGATRLKIGENIIEVEGGAHALDIDFLQVTPAG